MRFSYCISLFLSISSIGFAQTDTSSFFYFPLKAPNLWQYKEPPPPDEPYITEIRTGRDTTFSNGQTYSSFVTKNYGYTDTIGAVKFERQIDNKVYRYFPNQQKEFLIYDFSKSVGDTVSLFPNPQYTGDTMDTSVVIVLDSGIQSIFGTMRKYFTFYNKEIHGVLYWIDQVTDSIGITFSQIEPGYQLYLVGAIVDRLHFGMVTMVGDKTDIIPRDVILFQNYPNPFNPSTTFSYQLATDAHILFKIYNAVGQEVKTLVNDERLAGYHQEVWNASNVASGMYTYQLIVINQLGTKTFYQKKMLMVK